MMSPLKKPGRSRNWAFCRNRGTLPGSKGTSGQVLVTMLGGRVTYRAETFLASTR